ncbi:MAG: sulfotransferase [Sphingomonas sp.]|jgi:hypothetical protein|uniref:sulfotransferase n=1 Tax=Sphingomonas sp. TaxID=28214 RepID=UPI00356708AC
MTRHLIHIGYPKTGSTFLQHWFAAHPQIAYVHGGIAGFRNLYAMVAEAAAGETDYLWRVTSHEALASPFPDAGKRNIDLTWPGEGTPAERQARACALLADLFPDAHVLIVTRGFRSMILSSYSQYVRVGGTDDLETQIWQGGENPWRYDEAIAMYRARFGDRVIVLPYELLARDPVAFRGEMARRLGVAPFDFEDAVVNRALSPIELRWYPRMARLARRLPFRRRMARLYLGLVFDNRLAPLIALLDRLSPAKPVDGTIVTDAVLEAARGLSDGLAADPIFTPFARDYLFEHRLKPDPND